MDNEAVMAARIRNLEEQVAHLTAHLFNQTPVSMCNECRYIVEGW